MGTNRLFVSFSWPTWLCKLTPLQLGAKVVFFGDRLSWTLGVMMNVGPFGLGAANLTHKWAPGRQWLHRRAPAPALAGHMSGPRESESAAPSPPGRLGFGAQWRPQAVLAIHPSAHPSIHPFIHPASQPSRPSQESSWPPPTTTTGNSTSRLGRH